MKKLMAGALMLSLGLFTLGCGGSTPAKKTTPPSTPPAPAAKAPETKGAPAPAAPEAPKAPDKK